MKLNEVIESVGTRIVEGGPFMFEDFGESWVLLWEDELTVTFIVEDKEVIFVECMDMESKDDLYMWMNPKYADFQKKIYDELGDVKNHKCETMEEVLAVWHKNQTLYEDTPEDVKAELEDEKQFIEAAERGEIPPNDEIQIH